MPGGAGHGHFKCRNGKCPLSITCPLTSYVPYWYHLAFGVVCALMAPPGLPRVKKCIKKYSS